MPADQTEAVILRTQPLGEIDKLVVFFSKDKGVMRGAAKGARKFGNRFGSSLEPLSVAKVFFYEKEHRDMVTISSCDLIDSFFEMQASPETAFLLAYFVELLEEFVPSRAREELLYRLLLSALKSLRLGADRPLVAAYFETWFLRLNGLLPDLARCRKCGRRDGTLWLGPKKDGLFCDACADFRKEQVPAETAVFLEWVRRNPPPEAAASPFPVETLAAVRRVLRAVLVYHMEREPRSLRFVKD